MHCINVWESFLSLDGCWNSAPVKVLLYLSSLIHPTPELFFSVTLQLGWGKVVGIRNALSVYILHHRLHPCHWANHKISWQMMSVCRANTAFFTELKAMTTFPKDYFKKIILKYLCNSVWILRKLSWHPFAFCYCFAHIFLLLVHNSPVFFRNSSLLWTLLDKMLPIHMFYILGYERHNILVPEVHSKTLVWLLHIYTQSTLSVNYCCKI